MYIGTKSFLVPTLCVGMQIFAGMTDGLKKVLLFNAV
jgi:hypothetical protein